MKDEKRKGRLGGIGRMNDGYVGRGWERKGEASMLICTYVHTRKRYNGIFPKKQQAVYVIKWF